MSGEEETYSTDSSYHSQDDPLAQRPQLMMGYSDMQTTGGAVGLGSTIAGGAFDRLMRMLRPDEEIFESEFAAKLREILNYSSEEINRLKDIVKKIPYYWTKNPELLVYAIELNRSEGPLTPAKLTNYSKKRNKPEVDVLRYYFLIQNAFNLS